MADIRGADLRDTTAAGLGSRGRGNFENIDQAIGNKETKLPQAQGATIDAQLEKWKKSCDTAFSSPELVGECVSKVESAASDQEQ